MDNSFGRLALLAALAFPQIVIGQDGESQLIDITAGSLSFDGDGNAVIQGPLRITQGDIVIEAGEALASRPDFEDTQWRFTGGVRIVVDSVVLEADTAVFAFKANELTTGALEGAPASFTDDNSTRERRASGRARKLTYDYVDRTLRMLENAQLNQGTAEIRGCDLIYDFDEEKFASGSSDCGEPFTLRYQRRDDAAAGDVPDP